MIIVLLFSLLILFLIFKSLGMVFKGFKESFGFGILLSALFLFTVVVPLYLMIFVFIQPIPAHNPKIFFAVFTIFFTLVVAIALAYYVMSNKKPGNVKYGVLKQASRWNAVGFTLAAAFLLIFLPKIMVLKQLNAHAENLGNLQRLRMVISEYYKIHKNYPPDLSMLEEVPYLDVWAKDSNGKLHHHKKTNEVVLLPNIYDSDFEVEFLFNDTVVKSSGTESYPEKVSLVGDFNGFDMESDVMTKDNNQFHVIKILKAGIYRFGFVVDGELQGLVKEEIVFPSSYDNILVRPVGLKDEGKWGYDPAIGYVFIDCTGVDAKSYQPLYNY